jgi:hypothetical protein
MSQLDGGYMSGIGPAQSEMIELTREEMNGPNGPTAKTRFVVAGLHEQIEEDEWN